MADQAENQRAFDIAATAKNLSTAVATAHKVVVAEYPPLKDEDLERLVRPPTPDAHWTQADLDASVAAWQSDPTRPHLVQLGGNFNMAPVWRYTTRFFGKFPEEIIGEDNDLEYDASGNKAVDINGQSVPKPTWSASFAKPLLTVLSHDIWQDDPNAAAICLQYVVKCRKNDQRKMRWPKINPSTDSFFGQFRLVMSTAQTGTLTMPEIHQQVQKRLGKRSVWSKLFLEIEAFAFRANQAPLRSDPLTGDDVGTYTVGTAHLKLLIEALDAIKDRHGMPLYRKAEFMHKTADAAMKANNKPANKDFEAMRERALLAIRQRKAKAAKVAAAGAAAAAPAVPAPDPTATSAGAPAKPPVDRPTIAGGVRDDSEVPQIITFSEPSYGLPGRSAHEVSAEFAGLDI